MRAISSLRNLRVGGRDHIAMSLYTGYGIDDIPDDHIPMQRHVSMALEGWTKWRSLCEPSHAHAHIDTCMPLVESMTDGSVNTAIGGMNASLFHAWMGRSIMTLSRDPNPLSHAYARASILAYQAMTERTMDTLPHVTTMSNSTLALTWASMAKRAMNDERVPIDIHRCIQIATMRLAMHAHALCDDFKTYMGYGTSVKGSQSHRDIYASIPEMRGITDDVIIQAAAHRHTSPLLKKSAVHVKQMRMASSNASRDASSVLASISGMTPDAIYETASSMPEHVVSIITRIRKTDQELLLGIIDAVMRSASPEWMATCEQGIRSAEPCVDVDHDMAQVLMRGPCGDIWARICGIRGMGHTHVTATSSSQQAMAGSVVDMGRRYESLMYALRHDQHADADHILDDIKDRNPVFHRTDRDWNTGAWIHLMTNDRKVNVKPEHATQSMDVNWSDATQSWIVQRLLACPEPWHRKSQRMVIYLNAVIHATSGSEQARLAIPVIAAFQSAVHNHQQVATHHMGIRSIMPRHVMTLLEPQVMTALFTHDPISGKEHTIQNPWLILELPGKSPVGDWHDFFASSTAMRVAMSRGHTPEHLLAVAGLIDANALMQGAATLQRIEDDRG
jgi:hypothetical protein